MNFVISSHDLVATHCLSSVVRINQFFSSSSLYMFMANSLYLSCSCAHIAARESSGAFLCILRG